jgi:CubicO group peptidase (beta-lactamase class C family)
MTLTRRELLIHGVIGGAAAAATLPFFVTENVFAAEPGKYAAAFKAIDAMVERYVREMDAPGLTLTIADRTGVLRMASYGLSDLERKEPVRAEQLFQIGSISKSFTAAALLQLRDEGKLDLHAPVTRYLPWLKIEPREGITTHHLLTHSSGLPSWAPVFPTDPAARHTAGFTPGAHFWYCNAGYGMLGYLVETLDGRPYPEAIRARIFEPLGMKASVAYIGYDTRARSVNSYVPFTNDRPHARVGRLADAPQILFDNAAGSISSTPGDMGLYLRMIANRGKGLMPEKTFDEWVTARIPTSTDSEESYGYGWFTGKLDEHRMIRHTGGMVSFMSAMHADLDDGIAAFASVNAQLGYRPNPVTTYAIRAIRAVNSGQPIPDGPPIVATMTVPKAGELAGIYTSIDGDRLEFVAGEDDELFLLHGGKRYPIEHPRGQAILRTPEFELFPFVFDREKKTVAHGGRFWVGAGSTGEKTFTIPAAWNAFTGHYRGESAWVGSTRVVAREGKLWLDGVVPLRPVDANTFRLADPEYCPEWVQFADVVNGKSRRIKLSGEDLFRVDIP